MKRTKLTAGAKSLERGSTFEQRRSALTRAATKKKRGGIAPASILQRVKVKERPCVVCGVQRCDPSHLVDRSEGGTDDPRAVVALCRAHHRDYDDGRLSLLEHLEPDHRIELAYAVETVGLLRALERITNSRWRPAGPVDPTWKDAA